MRSIKLTIEYDGTRYAGWQIQPHRHTIQGTIQEVLHRITQEKVNLNGASRTDAGVHAMGQVAHFRTENKISCDRLQQALNGLLPNDISISRVVNAPVGFHSQRGAKKKRYRYLIWNGPARSALLKDRAWHLWTPLDVAAMKKGARSLVGRHDFSAFRAHQSSTKTSVRTMNRMMVSRKGRTIVIELTANGFLKYMVRNIVGTLVDVGKGRLKAGDLKKILESKDRKKAGATAPARGLYLVKVEF